MPIVARAAQCQIPHARQEARRELVQSVQEGMTAQEAREHCLVPMHRTTVYRLLNQVERFAVPGPAIGAGNTLRCFP